METSPILVRSGDYLTLFVSKLRGKAKVLERSLQLSTNKVRTQMPKSASSEALGCSSCTHTQLLFKAQYPLRPLPRPFPPPN